MRLTLLLPAVVAVSFTACGGLGSAARTASSPSPSSSSSPGRGGSAVAGKLVQVSAGVLVVSDQAGDAKVSYDASTSVLRTVAGSAADIAAGACVSATGQKDATGLLTADAVQVMLNMNGACTRPGGGGNGGGGGGQGRGSGTPPNFSGVSGKVASFDGSSMTVQVASGSLVSVTVPNTARVTRTESATSSQLAVGQCVRANGQKDAAGTVKARVVSIVPPAPGGCPQGRPNSTSNA